MNKSKLVDKVVDEAVNDFITDYFPRLIRESNKATGKINKKRNNVFVDCMGKEISFFSALVRSLESAIGILLQNIGINFAKELNIFDYFPLVEGKIITEQLNTIYSLIEKYKNKKNPMKPDIQDLKLIDSAYSEDSSTESLHLSDFYLKKKNTNNHYLIELKAGGDLDTKKAPDEKAEILKQYCMLKNKLGAEVNIKMFFATAYNKDGEGNLWKQASVRRYFSSQELLIGRDFWNFILDDDNGFDMTTDAFKRHGKKLERELKDVKNIYGIN